MAVLTITAANVLPSAGAKTARGIAGATITPGQPLYMDGAASNKLKPAAANNVATARVVGLALNGASDGQFVEYVVEDDDYTPGATLDLSAAGAKGVYVLAASAGGIAPVGDLVAGNRLVPLFMAKSATKAVLRIANTGAAVA